jgi:hypothetical protein
LQKYAPNEDLHKTALDEQLYLRQDLQTIWKSSQPPKQPCRAEKK